jgi:hypothetical protein
VRFCPSCRYTEDEDEPGLQNLHHVQADDTGGATTDGVRDDPTHHLGIEHVP